MLLKQKLFVFPTSRAIRSFINEQKGKSTLLPFTLTIDELFKKSIILENKKYIDEEERFLFLKESIKSIDVSKLGISDNFTKFLKQNEFRKFQLSTLTMSPLIIGKSLYSSIQVS